MKVANYGALRRFMTLDPLNGGKGRNDLDPDGFSVLDAVVPFMNDGSVHRVRVYAKRLGTDVPAEFMLDVHADAFDRLQDAKEFRDMLAKAQAREGATA